MNTSIADFVRTVRLRHFQLSVNARWKTTFWLSLFALGLAIDLSLRHPILLLITLLGGAIALCIRDLGRTILTARYWSFAVQFVLVLWGIGIGWVHFQSPADAAFFSQACSWMESTFGTALTGTNGATVTTAGGIGAIPLIFDALRAVLLLYAGISLVSVVQALRQDEECSNYKFGI